MKFLKVLLILLFLSLAFFAGHTLAQAQYRTESNAVTTVVGNPSIGTLAACPIPGAKINCGSKNVPINGCGHCGIGYEDYMSNCTYEGINYAMDIDGADFTPVLLPSVEGKTVEWTFVDQTNAVLVPAKGAPQAIQRYAGTNTVTGEKYWLQFHHSEPGSGNPGKHGSGTQGAKVCGDGCNMHHIHVEFAKIDPSGKMVWQDAPNYFCK